MTNRKDLRYANKGTDFISDSCGYPPINVGDVTMRRTAKMAGVRTVLL